MPHGWAMAEFWLLLRDGIAFEDGNSLVLFGGVPPQWFQAKEGMFAKGLATRFGDLDVSYMSVPGGAELEIRSTAPRPVIYCGSLPVCACEPALATDHCRSIRTASAVCRPM